MELWQELAEMFGEDASAFLTDNSKNSVRRTTVLSAIRTWVLKHINECEVIGPKRFRDEIQRTDMEAYKKYWI